MKEEATVSGPSRRRRVLGVVTMALMLWAGALAVVIVAQRGPSSPAGDAAAAGDGGPFRGSELAAGLARTSAVDFTLPDGQDPESEDSTHSASI